MKQNPFDEKVLEEDIRRIDRASEEIWSFYTTLKKEDISNLMQYEFICPKTGKRIKPQRIAYRGKGNIKPNGANVCGADFYYDDNTFCCSYEGTTWKEIYECNYSDTIRFRDKTNENKK